MVMRQEFRGPVGQVAAGDLHVHAAGKTLPPADSPASLVCPQCRDVTWRSTQHCVHCSFDLFAWADGRHRAIVRRRFYWIAAVSASGAAIAGAVSLMASGTLQTYLCVAALILSVLTIKTLDSAAR